MNENQFKQIIQEEMHRAFNYRKFKAFCLNL